MFVGLLSNITASGLLDSLGAKVLLIKRYLDCLGFEWLGGWSEVCSCFFVFFIVLILFCNLFEVNFESRPNFAQIKVIEVFNLTHKISNKR